MASTSDVELYDQLISLLGSIKHKRLLPTSPVPELTDAEARIVFAIYRVEPEMESLRSGLLAEISKITPSALSQILKSLVKKGVVERKHRPEDYRIVYVSLTEKGREMGDALAEAHRQNMLALIDYVGTDEVEHLVLGLQRVIEYYEKLAESGDATQLLEDRPSHGAHVTSLS